MAHRPHPEQGVRSCLTLINDAKRYEPAWVNATCKRALRIGAPTRRSVVAILKNGLDRVPDDEVGEEQLSLPIDHDSVRGGDYWARGPMAPQQQEGETDDRRRDAPKTTGDELLAMAEAFHELLREAPSAQRCFGEKMGCMVDKEWMARENRRLTRLLRAAKLTVMRVWRTYGQRQVAASPRPPSANSHLVAGSGVDTT